MVQSLICKLAQSSATGNGPNYVITVPVYHTQIDIVYKRMCVYINNSNQTIRTQVTTSQILFIIIYTLFCQPSTIRSVTLFALRITATSLRTQSKHYIIESVLITPSVCLAVQSRLAPVADCYIICGLSVTRAIPSLQSFHGATPAHNARPDHRHNKQKAQHQHTRTPSEIIKSEPVQQAQQWSICRDVCSYACMYVCTYVCMCTYYYTYVRTYVCMSVCMHGGQQALLLHASLNPHGQACGKLPPTQTNTSARLLVHTYYISVLRRTQHIKCCGY